uniref:Leucine-rich repeat protein n=1 Tax=Tanacetum cinerariifolium TaxID=118510 RepID=A0A699HW25_TANCI|nr:leucine-rich repeat protein [Tanacetum cinerariifolium]
MPHTVKNPKSATIDNLTEKANRGVYPDYTREPSDLTSGRPNVKNVTLLISDCGVEIAVASVATPSAKEWSKHLESSFRKRIDMLSKVNHKNFVNLLGFCEEDAPFTRMIAFEYAPNGTLFEHLHSENPRCFIEDKDLEFREVIKTPLPKEPLDTIVVDQWLPIEKVQRAAKPEHPSLEGY